ncbi:3237_t:CDS:2, partial [Funneliformis mosseae]
EGITAFYAISIYTVMQASDNLTILISKELFADVQSAKYNETDNQK